MSNIILAENLVLGFWKPVPNLGATLHIRFKSQFLLKLRPIVLKFRPIVLKLRPIVLKLRPIVLKLKTSFLQV